LEQSYLVSSFNNLVATTKEERIELMNDGWTLDKDVVDWYFRKLKGSKKWNRLLKRYENCCSFHFGLDPNVLLQNSPFFRY
jgi:hypothetical protein